MSDDRNRALHKIQKLLRLAKDGRGNPQEAETALRQAQSLMAKFNIDDAEATAQDIHNNVDAIIRAWCKGSLHVHAKQGKIPRWGNVLAVGVAKLYECRVYVGPNGDKGMMIMFGGYKTDVQVACWTYDYLMECVRRASYNFENLLKHGSYEGQRQAGLNPALVDMLLSKSSKYRMNRFRGGMCSELQRRLYKLADERKQHQEASKAGSALMVVKQDAIAKVFGDDDGITEGKDKELPLEDIISLNLGAREGAQTNLTPNPLKHNEPPPVLRLGA